VAEIVEEFSFSEYAIDDRLSRLKRLALETHGTLLHGKRVAVELIVRVLACLAEGLGIRATARVFEVDPNTVLQWLVEAADQLEAFCRVEIQRAQP
jgi:transposase-like protein